MVWSDSIFSFFPGNSQKKSKSKIETLQVDLGLLAVYIYTIIIHTTLPETNSKFAPENGWLEDDAFLLGPGLLSGAKTY